MLPFARLKGVHFGRIMLIDGHKQATAGFAPLLSMETNYDGDWTAHQADLIQVAQSGLAQLFSHCEGFAHDIPAFIQAHSRPPAAFYQGHRGRHCEQVLREDQLQRSIRAFLDTHTSLLVNQSQAVIREQIQAHIKAQPAFLWAVRKPGQSETAQWMYEHRGLMAIYAGLSLLFAIGGTRLAEALFDEALESSWQTVLWVWLCSLVSVLFMVLVTRLGFGLRAAISLLAGTALSLLSGVGYSFLMSMVVGLLTFGLLQYGLLNWWFRALNKREATDDSPPVSAGDKLEEDVLILEDQTGQNQLTHLVDIKPGTFRRRSLKVVLWLIHLLAQILYNKGSLGGIPSIHFARWVFIDNDRRLLFTSNYDGSWESYLGDFTDKAAQGLTAVWSNTIGFPRANDLTDAGARDEQPFKGWVRDHQLPTQVWYSAYPDLSVNNINNNSRIRADLFRPLSEKALARWFRRL